MKNLKNVILFIVVTSLFASFTECGKSDDSSSDN